MRNCIAVEFIFRDILYRIWSFHVNLMTLNENYAALITVGPGARCGVGRAEAPGRGDRRLSDPSHANLQGNRLPGRETKYGAIECSQRGARQKEASAGRAAEVDRVREGQGWYWNSYSPLLVFLDKKPPMQTEPWCFVFVRWTANAMVCSTRWKSET